MGASEEFAAVGLPQLMHDCGDGGVVVHRLGGEGPGTTVRGLWTGTGVVESVDEFGVRRVEAGEFSVSLDDILTVSIDDEVVIDGRRYAVTEVLGENTRKRLATVRLELADRVSAGSTRGRR